MKQLDTVQKEFMRPPERGISDELAKGETVLAMLMMIAKSHEQEGNIELAKKYRAYARKKRRV